MKHLMKSSIWARTGMLLAAFIVLGAAQKDASAEPPVGKMPYQGRLTNSAGNPLSGNYDLTFSLCDSAAGDCSAAPGRLWTETQSAVPVDRGLLSVTLGDAAPIPSSIFNSATAYLQIAVGADPAMTPRIRLLPSAYAFSAQTLQGYSYEAFVTTFSAQTVAGSKTFGGAVSASSLSVTGTITSTSAVTGGNASFRAVSASSLSVTGTITSTSAVTGGNASFRTAAISSLSVTGTITSTSVATAGGFVGVGSTLTLLNASNLELGTVPNERIDNSSVAKWNASGDIDNYRLDPSSVTLFGPVRSRSIIGIWQRINMAASLTDSQLLFAPLTAAIDSVAANARMTMPFAGIVRGIIVSGSAARTAGSATFQVFKNASDIGSGPDATIDATNTTYVASNSGTETFVAGDILDIRVTTSSGWAPTTAEWIAQIVVEWTN